MLTIAVDSVGVGSVGGRKRLTVLFRIEDHQPTKTEKQVQRPTHLMADRSQEARLERPRAFGLPAGDEQLVIHSFDAIGGLLQRVQRPPQFPASLSAFPAGQLVLPAIR